MDMVRSRCFPMLRRGRGLIGTIGGNGNCHQHQKFHQNNLPRHYTVSTGASSCHDDEHPRQLVLGVPTKRMQHGMAATPQTSYTKLEEPSIIYNDNHLLVVNKPPGWHSVPNPTHSSKCLLTKLRDMQLGGGSRQDFLLPIHRIDQPCSGLLLFGKTSKAASRITKLWKQKQVQKFYLAAVSSSNLEYLQRYSVPSKDSDEWFTLQGALESQKEGKQQRTVRIRPLSTAPAGTTAQQSKQQGTRILSVRWKLVEMPLLDDWVSPNNNPHSMIIVQTTDGARHTVRSLLSQVGKCPIQGDLRYGGNNTALGVLPDQSVALHAYRVQLDAKLQLGSLSTFEFEAPFPATWKSYFGFSVKTGIH
ncbi:unnamed protein product [Cylindrotheca closterium]|uniref:Pseudouridine synthase RsuA/RluA-like domain-containing protein n=1 Tax=Cylindrotheca closterium TaxID=2856 RepID=A0AAD2CA24_9STRA|nr:unnamed protein product [Cylindrotheca closterium]